MVMESFVERDALFELLVLEAKGFLNISGRRVIELCSGWGEDSCDEELEYRKYLEAYDKFLLIHNRYVMNNLHMFSVIQMFEDVDDFVNDGLDYRAAVIKMIRNKFKSISVNLAYPPDEFLSEKYAVGIQYSDTFMKPYMFRGKIVKNSLYFEIIEDEVE